jgi:hypothetical protein
MMDGVEMLGNAVRGKNYATNTTECFEVLEA